MTGVLPSEVMIPDPKVGADPLLHEVLRDAEGLSSSTEHYRATRLLDKDRLFPLLEQVEPERRVICYLDWGGTGGISLGDAAPIGSMLDAIGMCENLDLILNSPGGSGEAAEKLVHMCRTHCRNQFRVVVPNFAKSAATMVALGADEIVMGYSSELGPIDPQYLVTVGGTDHMVSGQSFIHAYDEAHERVQTAILEERPVEGFLYSLQQSSMEPAFIDHCRRGMDFSRDVAVQFLTKYQLPAKHKSEGRTRTAKQLRDEAVKLAENLLSENTRFTHRRSIGADEAREIGLNVAFKDQDDPEWRALWELYVRAEVYCQMTKEESSANKLFFDRASTLPVY